MNLLLSGLQRSGTNYVEKIFTERYRINFINLNDDKTYPGAKHFRLYDHKDIVPEPGYRNNVKIADYVTFEKKLNNIPAYCLIISKDPYSWLSSYEKWAIKCNWPQVQHHYVEEYNLFYGKWLELAKQTDKIVFIRYIDLLLDLKKELRRLEESIGLKKKLRSFFISAKCSQVSQSDEFTQDHLDYYLKEQYFNKYSEAKLVEVNSLLDLNVMSRLGYKLKNNG